MQIEVISEWLEQIQILPDLPNSPYRSKELYLKPKIHAYLTGGGIFILYEWISVGKRITQNPYAPRAQKRARSPVNDRASLQLSSIFLTF